MRITQSLAILLLLVCPVFAQEAQPGSIDELIRQLSAKASTVNSWTADLKMTMNMAGTPILYNGNTKSKGEMSSMALSGDVMGQTMVLQTITDPAGISWTLMDIGGMKQVMKMDMNQMAEAGSEMLGLTSPGMTSMADYADIEATIAGFAEMYELSVAPDAEISAHPVRVINGSLKKDFRENSQNEEMLQAMGMNADSIRIFFGQDDGFFRGMEVLGVDGGTIMRQEFANVVLNPEIDDAEFVFTPPDGVQVMDLTQMDLTDIAPGGLAPGGSEQYNTKFAVGDLAPEFEGTSLDGKNVKLTDYRGKVVLLDFWATWCPPCIEDLPNVIAAYKEFRDRDFEIIGVSLDENVDELNAFLAEHPEMTWPQIHTVGGWESPLPKLYEVNAIPFTLLLDRNGVIQALDLRGNALSEAIAAELSKSN